MLYTKDLVRPPTMTRDGSIARSTRHCSVDHFLKLFHREGPHSLRRRLRLEDARFLRERVDALAGRCCWFLLQLHVQHATKFEGASLLQLLRCELDEALHHTLYVLRLQACCLCNRAVRLGCRHASLHAFHCLHGFHCLHWCHCCRTRRGTQHKVEGDLRS